MALKPGMYATVEIHSTLARDRTLVPRSAILDTGERKVAFVSLGNGRFDPRPVRTGDLAQDGLVEVLDGLKPGEQVVTSGQFLLDSESNVREALAKMIRGNPLSDQAAASGESGGGEWTAMPAEAARPLEALLHDYLAIHEKLAADTIGGIAAPAEGIAQRIDDLLKVTPPDDPHFWHRHEEAAIARGKALELAQTGSLEEARLRFADLSVALGKLLSATGIPRTFGKEVQELHCPMFRQGQGGTIWLQLAGEARNPYLGSTMPGCFDQRKTLPIAGTVKAAPPPVGMPGQAPATQATPMPPDRPGSDR
jgi:Cu(I)/Ag(I) efflux system membrane fusion protein